MKPNRIDYPIKFDFTERLIDLTIKI